MKSRTARAMARWRLSVLCACCWACCWFLVLPLPGLGQDQVPYLVKDIAPESRGIDPVFDGLAADSFVTLGNLVLYANRDQVWVTDGTAAGTVQLADLPCLDCNGVAFLGTLGKLALFAQEEVSGASLWRTDGTRAGTIKLASIGLAGNQSIAALGGRLFFSGCAAAGCGLLRSDGTAAGTTVVAPVAAEAIAVWEGRMYFFAPQDTPGALVPRDLWVSDGTAAGTHVVTHFASLQLLLDVTGVAGGVVFIANLGQGEQLWTSDGTPPGTRRLTSFSASSAVPTLFLKALGGRAYFVADDGTHGVQLWATDGTAAGTGRVTDLVQPNALATGESSQLEQVGGDVVFFAGGAAGSVPWRTGGSPGKETPLCGPDCATGFAPALIKAGDRLFFVSLGSGFGNPASLWATDGTTAGTERVAGVCAGTCDVYSPLALVPLGGTVYFDVTPSAFSAPRLWKSDGTAAGTRLVSRRAPALGSLFEQLTSRGPAQAPIGARGAQLFFAATDDSGGEQVWVSDSTPGSERQLTDLVIPSSSYPVSLVAAGNHLFFLTGGPYNVQDSALWQSDGTGAGTQPVPGALPSPARASNPISAMTASSGMVFYVQGDATSGVPQLWRADGTAGGTLELTAFPSGQVLSSLAAAPAGGLYFAVQTAGTPPGPPAGPPAAVWRSDGTPQGTVKAFDLAAGTGSLNGLAVIGSALYFTAVDAQGSHAIWKSDGTAAGTVQLTVFAPEAGPNPYFDPGFTALGSRVFFIGLPPQPTLMVTDGTPAGTGPVAVPPLGPLAPFSLTVAGARIFMLDHNNQLWRSDGTAAGTAQVSSDCCLLPRLVAIGDKVFFKAAATGGTLLFSSDGTAAGTVPVFDPAATPVIDFQPLTAAGGRVFFAADDGEHGLELWQTDGTAQGTRMVDDLAPGAAWSSPTGMTAAGDLLFFSANDGLSGFELWALPLAGGPGCQPSDAWLCLLGGRFRVEAGWRDAQGSLNAGHAVALTADTGWFWFFGPNNVEVLLKVLDGTALDGHVWVFYGALSNVEYALTVTDTLTGVTRRYENPPGQLASVADTHAFGPMGAVSIPGQGSRSGAGSGQAHPALGSIGSGVAAAAAAGPRGSAGSCQAGPRRLCLEQDRFAVTVAWRDFAGHQGGGSTVPLTSDTGAFWFFAPANVELVVKVIDGRAVNGKFWVFYGALSDVEYTLTVTDTATGTVKTYHNPAGRLASVADTSAF
jgi:ELWxxDGT repeat protein